MIYRSYGVGQVPAGEHGTSHARKEDMYYNTLGVAYLKFMGELIHDGDKTNKRLKIFPFRSP